MGGLFLIALLLAVILSPVVESIAPGEIYLPSLPNKGEQVDCDFSDIAGDPN